MGHSCGPYKSRAPLCPIPAASPLPASSPPLCMHVWLRRKAGRRSWSVYRRLMHLFLNMFFSACGHLHESQGLEEGLKQWQELRSYELQEPRRRGYEEISIEFSCSPFNLLDRSGRIRRHADGKCHFSQSSQVATEKPGTPSMIHINTISIQFCIGGNRTQLFLNCFYSNNSSSFSLYLVYLIISFCLLVSPKLKKVTKI